jgi:hypothetical protein
MSIDIDPEISEQLSKSLIDTRIHLIQPTKNKLDEVLKLQSGNISTLNESRLTEYIYTLAQYSVFLNVQANTRKILFLESKRAYDAALNRAVSKVNGKTIKERASSVLESDEKLQQLEKDMRKKEADCILFENVPESVSEISNALKKELSFRFNTRKA